MNTYEKLEAALTLNAYTKGAHKGDAPADPSRRARNHIRITRRGDTMAVVMYGTDILTAYKDGAIRVNLSGWDSAPTTREAFNDAMGRYRRGSMPRMYVHSVKVFGLSQTGITVGNKTYRYTERMEFDAEGNLLTKPATFNAKRVDAEEFRKEIVESGFKAVYPLLYASVQPGDRAPVALLPRRIAEALGSEHMSHRWSGLIAGFKYSYGRNRYGRSELIETPDAKTCWTRMMAAVRVGMYHLVESDTTVLIHGTTPKFSPAVK